MPNARLVWEVWSLSGKGIFPRCRCVLDHSRWEFAEKLAWLLRERGHEEVEVRLSTRE